MLAQRLKAKQDRLTTKAMKSLYLSAQFKAGWLKQITKYENAYNGKWTPKFRQMFSVPLPVFSGMVDTLIADFNNPISLRFQSSNPALAEQMDLLSELWKQSNTTNDPKAKWAMQVRLDLKNAIMCGRGFSKIFAESDPTFAFHFKACSYRNMHAEPKGGPILEQHAFVQEEGIFKTPKELRDGANNDWYDKSQVEELARRIKDDEFRPEPISANATPDYWNRFKMLGEDPEGFNFTGQAMINGVEAVIMDNGEPWHIIYDPYTQIWLRCVPLKEDSPSKRLPWTTWSTHEDDILFWNKCYGSDIYPIHDSIGTLVNQDLTFRQKKIMQSRAYDTEMFPDVSLLDETGWREGVLVPVDTIGGTRQISSGLYEFNSQSGDLSGTIDMVNWLEQEAGKHTGVTELNQSGAQKGKAASITFSLLQQAEKRLSVKAAPRQESFTEVGIRFVEGASEHMTRKEAIKRLGSKGFGWKKIEKSEMIAIKVIDLTEQDKENVLGKDQRIKAAETIIGNETLIQQNNPKVLNEIIWKDIGGVNQEQLDRLTSLDAFASKDILGAADAAIQEIIKGKMPEMYYYANIAFLQKIQDFGKKHQVSLGKDKILMLTQYIQLHSQIAQENQLSMAMVLAQQSGQGGQQTPPSGNQPQSQPTSKMKTPAPQMSKMPVSGGQT